jgi:hypothetical protein
VAATYRVRVSDEAQDPADRADAPTGDPDQEPVAARTAPAHPVVTYTVLRLAILAAVGGVLYLLGLRDVWLILFAFLVSGVISAVVLNRRREGAAYGITSALRNVNARIDASSRAEDVDDDEDFGTTAPTGEEPDGPIRA